jgi:hypothetical protein
MSRALRYAFNLPFNAATMDHTVALRPSRAVKGPTIPVDMVIACPWMEPGTHVGTYIESFWLRFPLDECGDVRDTIRDEYQAYSVFDSVELDGSNQRVFVPKCEHFIRSNGVYPYYSEQQLIRGMASARLIATL